MSAKKAITKERAERIARGHACEHCAEYNYKKLVVKAVAEKDRSANGESWRAMKVCGVCGRQQELGIDAEGEILYVN